MSTVPPLNFEKIDEKMNEKLCLALVKAETEEEVAKILGPYIEDDSLWKPLGNRMGNYNTVGNQQSDATASLIENIVNSEDAVLIDRCLVEGVDPRSEKAPQSMSEAMERYFGIKDGDPNSISANERIKLSENIGIVATGDKKYPSISCYDKGVGQNPEKFIDTFLSLPGSKEVTSKSGIPFVQGLFNMGGTGVLPFCGKPNNDYNFKLVLSKRNPLLSDSDNNWGFTIIRKMPPPKKHMSSTYVYLAPKGKILTFKADGLPVLPSKYPNAYDNPLHSGTFIKLYNYQLPKPHVIVLELLYELSHQLFRPAIPVRMFEMRTGLESSHTLTSTMHGDIVRLNENTSKIMEDGFPKDYPIELDGIGSMTVTIYVLKKSARNGKWLGASGTHRLIFTVNGQVHDSKNSEFLKSEKVNKAYIADDTLVVINCDKIEDIAREKLFMPSRDRTRKNEMRTELEHQIQDLLKNHGGLIDLNDKRREDELQAARENKKSLESLVTKLVKRSITFSKLFDMGYEIQQPTIWKKIKRSDYIPSDPPTFFRIKDDKKLFEIPSNRGASIYIETDAPNDFFSRDKDRGSGPYINPKRFNRNFSLWNGILRLYLKPKAKLKPGIEIPVEVMIRDKRREPFNLKFKIKIVVNGTHTPPTSKKTWNMSEEYAEGDEVSWNGKIWISLMEKNFANQPDLSASWWKLKERKQQDKNFGRELTTDELGKPLPMKSLPDYKEVYKDDQNWISYNFDDGTGAYLVPNKESFDFFINLDNKHYLEEKNLVKKSGEAEYLQDQYITGLIIQCLAIVYEIKQKDPEMEHTDIAKMVTLASRGIAMSIIPTIRELGTTLK